MGGSERGSLPPIGHQGADVSKYEVIISWSDEDQAFIAEVPELPGCIADGAAYQEALANVEVIIKQWIETARELGRSLPQLRGREESSQCQP